MHWTRAALSPGSRPAPRAAEDAPGRPPSGGRDPENDTSEPEWSDRRGATAINHNRRLRLLSLGRKPGPQAARVHLPRPERSSVLDPVLYFFRSFALDTLLNRRHPRAPAALGAEADRAVPGPAPSSEVFGERVSPSCARDSPWDRGEQQTPQLGDLPRRTGSCTALLLLCPELNTGQHLCWTLGQTMILTKFGACRTIYLRTVNSVFITTGKNDVFI